MAARVEITEPIAMDLLFGIHDAWNKRDLERLLSYFVDDMTYWTTIGGPNGGPLTIVGKDGFRKRLEGFLLLDSLSVPNEYDFRNGVAQVRVEFYVRDPQSGYSLASSYRQKLRFRDGKVLRMEQHHYAPAASGFEALLKKK
jgi:ketosteroid isomerase-like protein